MDFHLSTQDEDYRKEVTGFLAENLPVDWSGSAAADPDQDWQFTLDMRRKLANRGWLTQAWPSEYGGRGASFTEQLVFSEEMAYHLAPGRDGFGVQMLGPTLMVHGSEEQKRTYLPPIARGEVQWCQGYSEPGSGSDLASLQTRAVRDGDDFVINGSKIWTSNAHRADHMFLLARTDPDAPKHRGISFLLIDNTKTPGITINPIINMTGAHSFNQVFFDNVRIPATNLVGELNRGWYVGMTLLDFERSGIEHPATARRTIEDLIKYARDTQTDGHPIISNPATRYELADRAIEAEAGRLMSYNIVWMQSQKLVPNKEASIAKLFGSELQQRVARTGMHLLGMHGQLRSGQPRTPLAGRILQLYLGTIPYTIFSGSSEIQRNVIANRGLGLPRG